MSKIVRCRSSHQKKNKIVQLKPIRKGITVFLRFLHFSIVSEEFGCEYICLRDSWELVGLFQWLSYRFLKLQFIGFLLVETLKTLVYYTPFNYIYTLQKDRRIYCHGRTSRLAPPMKSISNRRLVERHLPVYQQVYICWPMCTGHFYTTHWRILVAFLRIR